MSVLLVSVAGLAAGGGAPPSGCLRRSPPATPPPMTATPRSTLASQKSRCASIAAMVAAMRWRASVSSANTSICMAL